MIFRGNTNENLLLETIETGDHPIFREKLVSGLSIFWNRADHANLEIDGVDYALYKDQIVFLTELHSLKPVNIEQMRVLRFNRPFYCIVDHDSEVSCKGILFFGGSSVPVINLSEPELIKFETLWTLFEMEMQSKDNLQLEMLQVLLKRLLIMCTRIYKKQHNLSLVVNKKMDLIREFYYLVEKHFKEYRDVAYYASILNKSPKTLSNLFSELDVTPLRVIQERILLEARRQLHYTDLPIKEITYELGFEDIQTFSRFFKSKEKYSPAQFRIISRNGNREEKLSTHWEKLPNTIPSIQSNFVR